MSIHICHKLFRFFYQWRVHLLNRHKLIVVIHRDQKNFNVTIMNYKNSSTYVQRQINRFLRSFRDFARAYVDDIVMFSHIKKKHERHLRQIFDVLKKNNIFIKFAKIFFDYFSMSFLNQKINSFELITSKENLKTIAKFRFSRIFRQFEIYLKLTNWLRDYINHYVDLFKSFQNRKTKLLRHEFTIDNAKRNYSTKMRLFHSIDQKMIFFEILQFILSKSFYFVHVDSKKQFFIDLNVNKKFEINVMFYYVKKVFFKNF